MPDLTIPNTFVNSTDALKQAANATEINENFAAVQTLVNGLLDGDNFRALSDRKIIFDEGAGHDHDGINSKEIDSAPESGIVFADGGHDHSGGGDGSVLPTVDEDADTQGIIKIRSGSTDILSGASLIIDLDGSFTQTPYKVAVWNTIAPNTTSHGLGKYFKTVGGNQFGYYWELSDPFATGWYTRLTIHNHTGRNLKFYWRVIGV